MNDWSQLRFFSLNSLLKHPNDMQGTNRTLPILTFLVDFVKLTPCIPYTIYCKLFEVEKFCVFRGLVGNRKTFPVK